MNRIIIVGMFHFLGLWPSVILLVIDGIWGRIHEHMYGAVFCLFLVLWFGFDTEASC